MATVRWDNLCTIICQLHNTTSAEWGDQRHGGYNVVRFLNLGPNGETTVVVRVPYVPPDGWTVEEASSVSRRISSEVATMKYVEAYTSIPTPRVLHYSAETDGGGVGSPFIIMTKVDGVPLSSLWQNMENRQCHSVLQQVIEILLELSSHKFDRIGSLFCRRNDGTAEQSWSIEPLKVKGIEGSSTVSSNTFTSGTDYWIAKANENLKTTQESRFGDPNKIITYGMKWFLRSVIPTFYNNSLDAEGFLLAHGDFHSQNIMISIVDEEPRITAVIDWEFSSTEPTSSFAQFPFFIVDHPAWGPSDHPHPLRARNIHDQATFISLLRQAETKSNLPSTLSRLYETCLGVDLLEQCISDDIMFSGLYEPLFHLVYGNDLDFSLDYYAMLERGLLKREAGQFEKEAEVWSKARETLGEQLVIKYPSRQEFKALVLEHVDRFDQDGIVREWLEVALAESS